MSASSQGSELSLQDRLEEWIYRLNEQEHWIFRLYDWGNEVWAGLFFRGVRRRASLHDERVAAGGTEARVRFLTDGDLAAFVQLLGEFDVRYLPPHGLDSESAGRALRRRSYLPYGIWIDGKLIASSRPMSCSPKSPESAGSDWNTTRSSVGRAPITRSPWSSWRN